MDGLLAGVRRRTARRKSRLPERTGVQEIDDLRERVVDLEARLHALSISRRVLITLLVSADKKRKIEVARLKGEVEKLRERNSRYSRALAARDIQIHRLRFRLSEAGSLGLESRET